MKNKIRFSILASIFSLTLISTASAQTYGGGYWGPGAQTGTAYTVPGAPMMGGSKAPQYPGYAPARNWAQPQTQQPQAWQPQAWQPQTQQPQAQQPMTPPPPATTRTQAPDAPPTPPPPRKIKKVTVLTKDGFKTIPADQL